MKVESVSAGSNKPHGDLQTPVTSASSIPRLFGRKCSTWDRDEIEEILDYFQFEHWQTKRKTTLFDLMCHRVVQDRGVDESAIPATRLLRFIRGDDGATTQPLIGAKPQENDESESENGGSSGTGKSQNSLKRKHDDIDAPRITNLTDYWPGLPVRNCVVCSTELLRTVNTPWRRITSGCDHRSTICLACLQQHFENQLAMNGVNTIPCPMCHATLCPADIQAWSNPEFFDRYGRISVQQAMHEGLNFRWCAAPDCQNGFLCDPESESYATCDACGRMTCLNCDTDYHRGISCKDFQDQRTKAEEELRLKQEQDQQSMLEVDRISVRCPGNGCGAPIEKADGCDHMTCSRCEHAFCYICLVPWTRIITEGNQVHQQSCPHYRPIRERVPGQTRYRYQGRLTVPRNILERPIRDITDRRDHDEQECIARNHVADDSGFPDGTHQRAVVQLGAAEEDGIGVGIVEANTGAGNITMQLGTDIGDNREDHRRPSLLNSFAITPTFISPPIISRSLT